MREIVCKVCSKFPDAPQLRDDVWAKIAKPDDLLCLHHAEEALGRHIEPEDLGVCPANAFALKLAERRQENFD